MLRLFFKTEGDQITLSFSKVELGNYISEQMNAVQDPETIDSEIQIFQNALEFSGVKARDIMTPRTELVAVDLYSAVADLRQLFIETGYSKILVYLNTLDDIVGYVHSFELFKKPRTIKSVMIPVEFVPDTILIKDVMNLQQYGTYLAFEAKFHEELARLLIKRAKEQGPRGGRRNRD